MQQRNSTNHMERRISMNKSHQFHKEMNEYNENIGNPFNKNYSTEKPSKPKL